MTGDSCRPEPVGSPSASRFFVCLAYTTLAEPSIRHAVNASSAFKSNMSSVIRNMQAKIVGAGADGFWKSMPWLFLLLGLSFLDVAHFGIDATTQRSWHGFLIGVGSLTLSAGVFSVLLKSFQYIKLFRDELLSLFAEDAFRQRLEAVVRPSPASTSELRALVEPLVERFAKSHRAELSVGAVEHLRQLFSTFETDGYYRTFTRTIKIRAYDHVSRALQIDDDVFIDLVPSNPNRTVIYRSKVTSVDSNFEQGKLDVNGRDRSNLIKVEGHTIQCNLDLVGESSYKLRRRYTRTIDLSTDPYINLRITRPALELRLEVENQLPSLLNVIVRGVGFDTLREDLDFAVESPATESNGIKTTKLSKQSLTLPDEGYFIIFGVK